MNRNGMPLTCTICDKKPSFSDISHLLTHISSKQHLSNYFKIQVQSNGDDDAQRILDTFNNWYERWEMAELLKERMNQKEKKKGGKASDNKALARRATGDIKPQVRTTSKTNKKTAQVSRQGSIKTEHSRSFASTVAQPSAFRDNTMTSVGWRDGPQLKFEALSSDADAQGEYDLPSARRPGLRPLKNYRMSDSSLDCTSEPPDISEIEDKLPEIELKEGIKLKGIIWPGMDLFDAATPEMQRKRNQKKTTDVVAFLEATSRIIEPDEMIYDIDGEFIKYREITGDPDDRGTPLAGETTPEPDSPPLKKRTTRPRKSRTALRIKAENTDEFTSESTRRSQRSHTSFGNKRRAQQLSDEDDSYTYHASRPRRTGISIHRDNSGPEITLSQPTHDVSPYSYGLTPIENTFAQYNHRYDSSLSLSQQYQPASIGFRRTDRDLSAFGSLTHGFRPSYNAYSGVYRTAQQSNMRTPHFPSLQPQHSYDHTSSINWNAVPHLTAETSMLGMLDEPSNSAPVFWNSEPLFDDKENDVPQLKLKQEDDADTVSLPSDQK